MFRSLIIAVIFLAAVNTRVFAQNFTCADREVAQAAELWRGRIAKFWTGEKLPNWSAPCSITVKQDSGNGGATSFNFINGEVIGWSMSVQGTREGILQDVVPHEVNHTVLASIVRQPIIRWLDEGLSTLWESEKTKQSFFEDAYRDRNSPGQVFRLIDANEYPQDMQQVMAMYSTGYTLVEWLLTRFEPGSLLEFAKDNRLPSQKFQAHFGITLQQAETEWRRWLEDSQSSPEVYLVNRPLLYGDKNGLPTLHVATSSWCGPCAAFWFDMRTDLRFRAAVMSRVNVVAVDFAQQEQWLTQRGVKVVPTYLLNEQVVFSGYGSRPGIVIRKQDFISNLDRAVANHKPTATEVVISEPEIVTEEQPVLTIPGPGPVIIENTVPYPIENVEAEPVPVPLSTPAEESLPVEEPSVRDRVKGWAWDGLSAWGWAAIGAGVAGPIGIAIPWVGRLIHGRLRTKNDTSWRPPTNQNPPQVPPPPPQATGPCCRTEKRPKQDDRTQKSLDAIMELLIRREREQADQVSNPATTQEETAHATKFPDSQQAPQSIPGRNTDELSQLVQLSRLEGHDPLLDAAFGLFVQDETNSLLERESTPPEERQFIENLLRRVRDRVDRAAPLSVQHQS